jgi:putative nucleotidyltransferase with HDIG domain
MKEQQAAYILIIDDEPYIQEIVKRGLRPFGYRFETAGSAQEAMNKLEGCPFDLVVCDIRMPQGDGLSILKYIKTHYPETAVIMLTAVYDVQTAIKCLRNGASNYLIKPINITNLAFSVKEALEKRKLIIENKEYQLHLEEKVAQQSERLQRIYLDTVKTMANCLEAKDIYTRGHSKRVTDYALELAKAISLPAETMYQIQLAGLLHDIGKIGVPETILNKPGGLTVEEFDKIKLHPQISIQILKPIIHDENVIANIEHHHERFDGKGYPDGQLGKQIPLGARILSVADAFDAMTSTRAYRKAMSKKQAVYELLCNAGKQFDAELVTPFVRLVNSVTSLQKLWHLPHLITSKGLESCFSACTEERRVS